MAKHRTDQEWQSFFEQYESRSLSQCVFCERNALGLPAFYVKRVR